ncbi:MAG: hypothetical protein IJF12_03505 [Alphaproteobacteria bacterium]|nr:hypothetical protein [Alphaproteobacteria bacterium]
MDMNKQSFVYSYPLDKKNIEKPKNLDKMIELAEKLSKDFNHVRVDFYRLDDGTVYFGEMTFTPMSGVCKWNDEKINILLGKKIRLPKLAYNIDTGEYYKLPNYKLKSFLQNMFSVKNSPKNKKHKIITILGLKIKVKRKGKLK